MKEQREREVVIIVGAMVIMSLFMIPTIPTHNMLIWYQLKVYQQALGFGWALFCGWNYGNEN